MLVKMPNPQNQPPLMGDTFLKCRSTRRSASFAAASWR